MISAMKALTKAIEVAGGVGKLAAALGIKQNVVSNWRARSKAPADRCLAIEAATGVTRHELRPDVFGSAAGESKAA